MRSDDGQPRLAHRLPPTVVLHVRPEHRVVPVVDVILGGFLLSVLIAWVLVAVLSRMDHEEMA